MTSFRLLTTVALAIAAAGGCGGSHRVNLSDEEAAIRRTDADWLAAAASHDVNRVLPFWADDATILAPGKPPIGRFGVTSTGTDRISLNGPDGKSLTEEGRGVTIWKKQTDGSWKCVLDVMSPAEASSVK